VSETEIENEIRKFIIENFLFGDASAAPRSDQALVQSGLVDSTGILEIVAFLEAKFEVTTADEELAAENFGTVATIARFVAQKKKKG
jgi:acyl carrier protein